MITNGYDVEETTLEFLLSERLIRARQGLGKVTEPLLYATTGKEFAASDGLCKGPLNI